MYINTYQNYNKDTKNTNTNQHNLEHMKNQDSPSKVYLVEYLCDTIKQINLELLKTAKQLIILSSNNGQGSRKFIQSFPSCQNLSTVSCKKQGVPYFYLVHKKYVIADFGRYLLPDDNNKNKSYQFMLNIFYAFRFVSEIKVLLVIEEKQLLSLQFTQILDTLKNLQNSFGTARSLAQKQSLFQVNDSIFASVGLLVTDEKQFIKKKKYEQKIKAISSSKVLKQNPKAPNINIKIMKNILSKKHIIFQSDPQQQSWQSLKQIPSFSINKQNLFISSLLANKRHDAAINPIINGIEKYLNQVCTIVLQIKNRIPEIISLKQPQRKSALNDIQTLLPAINFKKLRPGQRSGTKNQFLLVITYMLEDFGKICVDIDLNNVCPTKMCVPWIIIHNIFQWDSICYKTVLDQSQIYMLGYFTKICYQIFSFLPVRQFNDRLSPLILQIFIMTLTHLAWSLTSWLQSVKQNGIRPKLLRQVIQRLERVLVFIDQIGQKNPESLTSALDQIQNHKKYIEIALVSIKYLYLGKMINHLTENEKIKYISQLYMMVFQSQMQLLNINGEQTLNLLRLIYDTLGDMLVKYQLYGMAIKCYQYGTIFSKLYDTCCKYLQEKLQQIKMNDFQNVIDILIKLGMATRARNFCYQYIEKINNQNRVFIYHLLYSFSDEQMKGGNSVQMGFIKNSTSQKINLLSKQYFSQIIEIIREHQVNGINSLALLPDLH